MNIPKWAQDLDREATGMPFGDLDVRITRHRSKTTKVTYKKDSKLRYSDNKKAFSDLETLINSMITAKFSGKLSFDVELKEGTIELVTIKNKEIKSYRDN